MSSLLALFYEEGSLGIFVLVSIVLGGGAAALAGRAIAQTWRTRWQVVGYMLILGAAVRFIHFALFGGTLLSVHYYTVDALICMAFGFVGFQAARATQMIRQYPWINASNGPFRWRRKPP